VVVKNALQQRKLELEVERLKEDGRRELQIIGESVPMKALRQQLALMAATNGRVLIYGESGSGKELVAPRHSQQQRAGRRSFRRSKLRRDSRRPHRKRSCSGIAKAASPAPLKIRPASCKRPTAARCSWTKSET